MATAVVNLSQIAGQWRAARRIYPIYAALVRQFDLGVSPSRDLESPIDRSEAETIARVNAWFESVDAKVQVWQLRQLLQTSHIATEDSLRALFMRQFNKPVKNAGIRDIIDYLAVQYFAHCSPQDSHSSTVTFHHVAEVLVPILGPVDDEIPDSVARLEIVLSELESCKSLGDLLELRILERAREIKEHAGDDYFLPASLVEFARFNFCLRLGFFRLMHADLHAIRYALHEMEARHQSACDVSSAGLSAAEPLANIRQICHEWKKPFRAAYSAGNNFKQLIQIRAAVEAELQRILTMPEPAAAPAEPEAVADVAVQAEPEAATAAPEEAVEEKIVASQLEPEPVAKPVMAPAKTVPATMPVAKAATAQAGPASAAATAAAPAQEDLLVETCLEQIAEQLINVPIKSSSVSHVMLNGSKLLLASWELAAFVQGGDEVSDSLQRAVAARAILDLALGRKKRGESVDLGAALKVAHAEAAEMQARIAEAKDKRNIDAAVNLAATCKRLLGLVETAEKTK